MRCLPILGFGRSRLPRIAGLADDEIGPRPVSGIGPIVGRMRLPNDPIGTFTLTLTNVVVGSRVHVEKQSDGTSFYDELADASTVSIPLSVYSSGSAYNDLRIKVRKGSSGTTYKPWETQATAIVGSQSIYVSQIPDE